MQVDLLCPGRLALQATAGSEFTVPRSPGRWIARASECAVDQGEVRFATGPRFHRARLRIALPSARVEVVGTTLAVICDRDSSCACVLDGQVTMTDMAGTVATVHAGERRTVSRDKPAHVEPIRPMERMKLQMLDDRARSLFEDSVPQSRPKE
jgi:hypothetical protein